MARRWTMSQSELLRHGHALNDHYCPNEATCRHAVIDMSVLDREYCEEDVEKQRLVLLNAGRGRYDPEETESRHPTKRGRFDAHGYEYSIPSMSGYNPSSDGEDQDGAYSDSVKSTSSTYQVPSQFSANVHEREEAKIGRAFTKQLTHDSFVTRTRLAYLESYTIASSEQLAERCDGLTDICALFNQQYKLLMRQYDDLLGMVQKQGKELRRSLDIVQDGMKDESRRKAIQVRTPALSASILQSADDFDVHPQKFSESPAENEAFPSPLSDDSGVFMSERCKQPADQTRLLVVAQGSVGSKKRKATARSGGISKVAKQRRI